MIRVLIADDSAFMRHVLSDLFSKQPDFEVVWKAKDGQEALQKTLELKPDLLTMDVNMPVMDGLQALEAIMQQRPTPVVMLSSLTQEGTEQTIKALSLGAVDFISKAGGSISKLDPIQVELLEKCRAAAKAHVHKPQAQGSQVRPVSKAGPPVMRKVDMPQRQGYQPKPLPGMPEKPKVGVNPYGAQRRNTILEAKAAQARPVRPSPAAMGAGGKGADKLVAIGTSTGGPQALQAVVTRLPGKLPCGVVIVQHMPAGFTNALAKRLDSISEVSVKEAENGDIVEPGHVYIAPGNYHLRVQSEGQTHTLVLGQDPPVGNHRPAVNVMYDSVADLGKRLVAVIMTGMGSDGCEGMKKIKAAGGYSIAQDEETCVVYGMPKSVVDAGLADEVKPLQDIAQAIVEAVKR